MDIFRIPLQLFCGHLTHFYSISNQKRKTRLLEHPVCYFKTSYSEGDTVLIFNGYMMNVSGNDEGNYKLVFYKKNLQYILYFSHTIKFKLYFNCSLNIIHAITNLIQLTMIHALF